MLILIAVTIQVVINSGLLEKAGETAQGYKNAQEYEATMNDIEVNGYNSIDDYLENKDNLPVIGAGEKATDTSEYMDTNGDIAVIPGGFTVSGVASEGTIDGGLVIYLIPEGETVDWTNPTSVATAQTTYDQFVWIPIKNTTDANAQDINDMYICQAKTADNGVCNITVENGEAKCITHNSNQMAGRLYASKTGNFFEESYTEVYTVSEGLREPDVLRATDYADGNITYLSQLSEILGTAGYDTIDNFKQSLQKEYNEVVKSVYENQGFYIGRYETSGMVNKGENVIVKSVAGTNTGIHTVTWYRMYAQQKKYAENKGLTSVKSTMMQGAAYDQVMKFVENERRPDNALYTIKIEGNTLHNRANEYGPWQTGGLDFTPEEQYNDFVNNIYDLEGNVVTSTTEAYYSNFRVNRGGSYDVTIQTSCRNYAGPHISSVNSGSCLQLYVNL